MTTDQGTAPAPVTFAGDPAGGGLALTARLAARLRSRIGAVPVGRADTAGAATGMRTTAGRATEKPAGTPTEAEFTALTGRFRRELLAHCYRLTGSVDDAEDLVQETYLRAWRAFGAFEGRSSTRTWLYRIATNAALNALRGAARRPLPSGLGPPSPAGAAAGHGSGSGSEVGWLQPIPDALVVPASDDPAAIAETRASLRLALIASLQYLPPRQRAVLLLRDVLAFPASEVAAQLDMSTAAVKSSLQRARARLAALGEATGQVSEPREPAARALLDRYIAAFENADADGLAHLLRADATLEMPPSAAWYAGREATAHATSGLGAPGTWRMFPTWANGQPAAVVHRRGPDGGHHPFGLAVLTPRGAGLGRLTVFCEPGLVARFGVGGAGLVTTTRPAPPGGPPLSRRGSRSTAGGTV